MSDTNARPEENKRVTQRVTSTQKEFSELQRKYHEIDANHISLQVRRVHCIYIEGEHRSLTARRTVREDTSGTRARCVEELEHVAGQGTQSEVERHPRAAQTEGK